MEEAYRKGYVYVQNNFAGIIMETDEGYFLPMIRDIWKERMPLR